MIRHKLNDKYCNYRWEMKLWIFWCFGRSVLSHWALQHGCSHGNRLQGPQHEAADEAVPPGWTIQSTRPCRVAQLRPPHSAACPTCPGQPGGRSPLQQHPCSTQFRAAMGCQEDPVSIPTTTWSFCDLLSPPPAPQAEFGGTVAWEIWRSANRGGRFCYFFFVRKLQYFCSSVGWSLLQFMMRQIMF